MKTKPIPDFPTEAAEQDFWAEQDSTEFVDWVQAETVTLPKLRPTLKTISLRLPAHLLGSLRMLANKQDVPYQSLLKTYLADRVRQELAGLSYPSGGLDLALEVRDPGSDVVTPRPPKAGPAPSRRKRETK
jgi:predicted DNA binding CopG/RHH family protein